MTPWHVVLNAACHNLNSAHEVLSCVHVLPSGTCEADLLLLLYSSG